MTKLVRGEADGVQAQEHGGGRPGARPARASQIDSELMTEIVARGR
jgi:hypothetical protein